MRLSHFQNESHIPQLFIRKFSPREPKCPNGVAVRDWDGQFIFRTNHTYIKVVIKLPRKYNPIGVIFNTIMPFCLSIKDCQSQASFNDPTIKGLGLKILA